MDEIFFTCTGSARCRRYTIGSDDANKIGRVNMCERGEGMEGMGGSETETDISGQVTEQMTRRKVRRRCRIQSVGDRKKKKKSPIAAADYTVPNIFSSSARPGDGNISKKEKNESVYRVTGSEGGNGV